MEKLITTFFGDKPNYALLMGSEVALFGVVNALLDVVLPIDPDTVPPEERHANRELRPLVDQGLTKLFDPHDGVVNISRVKQKRTYPDPAKPFLHLETTKNGRTA